MDALHIANGNNKKSRRSLDYYPTPPNVTHALMQYFELSKCDIWEPACGTGEMSEVLKSYGHEVISTDIRDTGYGTGNIDFLQERMKCDAIITNPPFKTSEEFIRHGLKQAHIVAMLLKSQYWHAKKRIELFEKYPPAYVLPLTWRPDFMGGERGGAPTMEVQWNVWIGGQRDTKYRLLKKPLEIKQ